MSRVIELIPVEGLPEVHAGDDVAEMICACVSLQPSDIVVVAQKIVSKSEGRTVDMTTIKASDEATSIAGRLIAKPDPRIVQVVLEESVRVLRSERVLITETRQGYVAANSGVDHSNVVGDNMVTLLPVDPDDSAARLRARIASLTGVDVGVIISDTFGRPWRIGIVNVALGLSGLPAVVDLRGTPDDAGKELHATVLAVADEIAAAAGVVMGKTARTPAVIVRGLELHGDGVGHDLIRPHTEDLFR